MRLPHVSIVLCSYNRAHLIERALRSVERQSFADWELWIVDDGSEDDTSAVVGRWLEREPRTRLWRQSNQGLSAARNAGITRATGEWITFLDSDDEYAPDHLERRVELARARPEIEFIHGGFEVVGGGPDAWHVPDADRPGERIHLNDCVIGATFFARRHVFESLGGFDTAQDFANDYQLFQKIEPRFQVAKIDAPTYRYHRDAPDSMCNTEAPD